DSDWNNFGPRIGFAWSLNNRMVIRGGYALSYIPIVTSVINLGYTLDTPWVSTTDGGITVKDRLSNPFPAGKLEPTGNSQGLATLVGQGVRYVDPADVYPQYHNYQLSIQRALPSKSVIEVAYVASRGIRLKSPGINVNQLPAEYFSMGTALTRQVANPFYGVLTTGSLSGSTVSQMQLLRPYPQFTGVTRTDPGYGSSVYHSLQIKYEKRMAHGLAALVAGTISKNISDLHTPQNIYNLKPERALTEIDAPSRLSAALAWEVPVGRGRQFLGALNRAADLAIGGWQVSSSVIFQDGMPMAFGVTGGTYVGNSIRPNVVGDPSEGASGPHVRRLNRYFNTTAFARPPDFTLGNLAPRIGSVRSPGNNTINVSLSKVFAIREGVRLEFRATAFNLPNHPVFGAPNTTFGSAAFGTVSSQVNNGRQVELGARILF
ncbi:MAG: carboxypeptidase regulatory-like domain-containing protein, partial [Acidobacteriota bacterium]